MTLYRPVGLAELHLIADLNWRAFPPRLPIQPIFYPVLNEEYATYIASQWNPNDPVSGYCGFVLRFEIDDAFAARYPVQVVGGRVHQELWVPAEELDEFNAHITGPMEVVAQFYGEKFEGKKLGDKETGDEKDRIEAL